MGAYCVYRPKKDSNNSTELFDKIGMGVRSAIEDSQQAYKTTWNIYHVACSPKFKDMYKDTLSLDAEGFPTYESLIKTDPVKELLGDGYNKVLAGRFNPVDNNTDNYNSLLEQAYNFNNDSNDKVAVVEQRKDGKLHVNVYDRTPENLRKAQEQYATKVINQRVVDDYLSPLGITIGELSAEEAKHRNGKTDFSAAKDILGDCNSLIQVANSMQGANAIGEEFSHLIVGLKDRNKIIDRLINALANNEEALRELLGDRFEAELEAHNNNLEELAEEALGQLLRDKLVQQTTDELFNNTENTKGISNLFSRLKNYIINKFKGKKLSNSIDILSEAEFAMNSLAKEIISGDLKLTKTKIMNSKRAAVFNSLADQIAKTKEVIEQAKDNEVKRYTLSKDPALKAQQQEMVNLLESLTSDTNPIESVEVLYKYMSKALKDLEHVARRLDDLDKVSTYKDKFAILRNAKSYLDSYKDIQDMLYEVSAYNDADEDANMFKTAFMVNINGEEKAINVMEELHNLCNLSKEIEGKFMNHIIPTFMAGFKEFLGPIVDENGKPIDIKEMLKTQVGDISILDRYLDSLASSSDILLQVFDNIVKDAKGKARLESLQEVRKILAFKLKYEKKGLTSFDWMFEKYRDGTKTGNYIEPSGVNTAQYLRDLEEENKRLEKKYGKNPMGEDLENANKEKLAWIKAHSTMDFRGEWIPKESLYKDDSYDRLSNVQKEFLAEFMEMKGKYDTLYGLHRTGNKAIQIRKNKLQRFIDGVSNPSKIISNLEEAWDNATKESDDDDQIYGSSRSTQIGFDGRPWRTLPILYQNRLKNADELSTDVISTLMAYSIASTKYKHLSEVVDGLEVGKEIVRNRKVLATDVEGNVIEENIKILGKEVKRKASKEGNYAYDKLVDYLDTQIYGRMEEEGFKIKNPINKKVTDSNKVVSSLMSMAATTQLAFNYLAGGANVLTGIAMTNIEVAGGRTLGHGSKDSARNLRKADAAYLSMLKEFLPELNSTIKTSKLALFDELFNVKAQFDNAGNQSQRVNKLLRLLDKNIQFAQQECGDHWLYNRIALAMAMNEDVTLADGTKTKLWDVLKVITDEETGLKKMVLPEGLIGRDGKPFDIHNFTARIMDVNHRCFGIYNEDDRVAAKKYAIGRLTLMYRDWMKPALNARFEGKKYNTVQGWWEEGYYRTALRIAGDMVRFKFNVISQWDELKDYEKSNLKKAMFELAQTGAVFGLVMALRALGEGKDPKKRPWALKLIEYMANRELHELGNLTPSLIMGREMLATVQSPTAVLGPINNTLSWMSALISPSAWTNEIESGTWEGYTKVEKKTLQLPIPVLQWWHQLDKFTGKIDYALDYYVRVQSQY